MVLILYFVELIGLVHGHGRLMSPPGRGTLWRYKDTNPLLADFASVIKSNYNDNENNCGGLSYQISQNYKCGVCGDSVGATEPRNHEDRGKFGLGIVAAQYEANSVVTTQSQITAHHKVLS